MVKKRRRSLAGRGRQYIDRRVEDAQVLSNDLIDSLGTTDDNNRLVAPPRRKRRKKATSNAADLTSVRDRRRQQIDKRKEGEKELERVLQELQRHALSSDQWQKLQQRCLAKRAKKRRSTTPSDKESDTESVSEDVGHELPAFPESIPRLPIPLETSVAAENVEEAIEDLRGTARQEKDTSDHEESRTVEAKGQHRVVHVSRRAEIESVRSDLPIIGYEQEIIEAIMQNDVVIICGRTGCGKTTQVPQFLYEAGYGCKTYSERCGWIGVTQPRRLAAVSTATRVAEELDTRLGRTVGYQIRHENVTSSDTSIKFMTDGILIRELLQDFLLRSYSVLVIDEAHERSLNTDLILGMLTRIVRLRRRLTSTTPLKVIIMSATLESSAFLSNKHLFTKAPPVIEIPARQFSVTVHFSRKTPVDDYDNAVMQKVCRIHRQLPPGAILVFLTGKREIDKFCVKLRQRLTPRPTLGTYSVSEDDNACNELEIDDGSSDEDVEVLPGDAQFEEEKEMVEGSCRDVIVLPLYAMLPPQQQSRVFYPVPKGTRLIVVATNVAETSITIPGVRYVVDAGRAKMKTLHPETGISRFEVKWISKASAIQRAGRAGRTLPGHCYRLYSSAHFGQQFEDYDRPEIQSVSLEDVVLLMKSMNIDKVLNFPFPSPPDPHALLSAENVLLAIGAIDGQGKITALGRQIVDFPVGVRQARMVLRAKEIEESEEIDGLTLFSLSVAAAMSIESPFLVDNGAGEKKTVKRAQRQFSCSTSDPVSVLNALCQYKAHRDPAAFCKQHFLHLKIMKEIVALDKQLRQIFLKTINANCPEAVSTLLPEPSNIMIDHLRRCIVAGWCDQVSRREGDLPSGKKLRHIPYISQRETQSVLHIHPTSTLAKTTPQYVVYTHAMKTAKYVYMNSLTRVEPEWIFTAAESLCTVQLSPAQTPSPFYDFKHDAVYTWHRVQYGQHDWELPLQSIPARDTSIAASVFAYAILTGQVFDGDLIGDENQLVATPKYVTTVEAKFHKRLGLLYQELHSRHVYSKHDLIEQLHSNETFLLAEIKAWMKPIVWPRFEHAWRACVKRLCK